MIEGVDKLKSRLDDNASIYSGEDKRDTKQKFKEMSFKEKWQFFKDYMLSKLVVGLIIVGFIGWFLWSTLGPKPDTILYVATINNPLVTDVVDLMKSNLSDALNIENPKKQEVFFDTNYDFNTDEYYGRMKFATILAAGEIDALILPEYELANEVNGGICEDLLNGEISSEILAAIDEYLIYMTPSVEEVDGSFTTYPESAFAIDITASIERIAGYKVRSKYCLVIPANAPHKGNVETMIKYLFEL